MRKTTILSTIKLNAKHVEMFSMFWSRHKIKIKIFFYIDEHVSQVWVSVVAIGS